MGLLQAPPSALERWRARLAGWAPWLPWLGGRAPRAPAAVLVPSSVRVLDTDR